MRFGIMLLLLMTACSDNTGYDRNDGLSQEQDGPAFPFSSFETRLTPNLAISGTICQGNERAQSEGRTYTCHRDNWLVIVDDVNFCTPEGCTEVEVRPIIAGLQSRNSGGTTQFLDIIPVIPVSSRTEDILEDVLLQYTQTEDPVVVYD